jgi:hypothetical protein
VEKRGARSSPLPGLVAGGCLLAALGLLGFLGGVLVATRVLSTSQMGWDQLAGFLSGGAAGGLAGLVAAALVVRRLGVARRFAVALAALAAAALAFAYLRATAPRRPAAQERVAFAQAGGGSGCLPSVTKPGGTA